MLSVPTRFYDLAYESEDLVNLSKTIEQACCRLYSDTGVLRLSDEEIIRL